MIADDIADNEEETIVIQEKFIRTKGKCKTHLRPNDIYLELKLRDRAGKCRGAGRLEWRPESVMERSDNDKPQMSYNIVHGDIWYHIADHIPPEYVQTFALICRQTAALVNTQRFWKKIYRSYCQKSSAETNWILTLPEYLQSHNVLNCELATMRARVVESLFQTYSPLSDRMAKGYSLDKLIGYSYVSSWHEQEECVWIACYKFCNKQQNKTEVKKGRDLNEFLSNGCETDDWETLAEDNKLCMKSKYIPAKNHTNEGVCLLVIRCDRFIPFPTHLFYDSGRSRVLLLGTRQMLAKDMRAINLELDFGDSSSKIITTVKYPKVASVKAFPWWHPDFRKYSIW
ncbi:transmembrane protein 183 [Bactrocera neohumeralis]|uniref:transmembrane protein 183 n=1 Tax=Bactrocera neohumeralis TaxID=98809 RepID=UPI002165B242|nr:transmembrane protein 183 [Bactrocera neohumeralis]